MPDTVNIAGYELLGKIGSGAAGTVYKARQISMDRLVAIKMLPSGLARDKRFIERFQREARAVAKLNHPHVVTGIDVGESGGHWYFVMEYVDGESAASRVGRDEAIPEKEALEITRQVSLALDHAYKNGIIHRDIKPANILMTSGGLAKLADLGVAKQGEGEGGAGGRVFGTTTCRPSRPAAAGTSTSGATSTRSGPRSTIS
jgi:serine/threonine-protein kinase